MALQTHPLLGNGSLTVMWSQQQLHTQQEKSCGKWCFLWGPPWGYITRPNSSFRRVELCDGRLPWVGCEPAKGVSLELAVRRDVRQPARTWARKQRNVRIGSRCLATLVKTVRSHLCYSEV
jgi:hypothetical protein